MLQLCAGYPITALGHVCAATGKDASNGEQTVDLGISVDDTTPNGDIFISIDYAQEIARLVGFVDPLELEKTRAMAAKYHAQVDQLQAELEQTRSTLSGLIATMKTDPDLAKRVARDAKKAPKAAGEVLEPAADPW